MAVRKITKADLRRTYSIWIEAGLVVALLVLIAVARLDLRASEEPLPLALTQEVAQMEEILPTEIKQQLPPPPRPPVPVEVPDDTILEGDELDLDASLDVEKPLANSPPPPPPPVEEEEPEPEIFVVVEQMPELIGGLVGIQKQIRYPEMARRAGVEGRVFLEFIVDENGNVAEAKVVEGRGIGAGCDEEALRVLRQARFKPGRQRGKAVKVKMSLSIIFKLR